MEIVGAVVVVVQKLRRSTPIFISSLTIVENMSLNHHHGTYGMFCGTKAVLGVQERPLIEADSLSS
jgi:hypothetical protein